MIVGRPPYLAHALVAGLLSSGFFSSPFFFPFSGKLVAPFQIEGLKAFLG
jgi:hypothetical protein